MEKGLKIMISGVGGQGIVFLTNIIVEAAMQNKTPVSVSEIHGLSQRGGVVSAGIGLGKNYTGFIGKSDCDFLIGLEPLETQRCLPFLHKNSSVVFADYRIPPFSVNAQMAKYPPVNEFVDYLKSQCREVCFISKFPEIESTQQNIFLLGIAVRMKGFPFNRKIVEKAIRATVRNNIEKTMQVFKNALKFNVQ